MKTRGTVGMGFSFSATDCSEKAYKLIKVSGIFYFSVSRMKVISIPNIPLSISVLRKSRNTLQGTVSERDIMQADH